MEQRGEGVLAWQEPFVPLRLPKLFNLRSDPFENADIASQMYYTKWRGDRFFMLLPAGALVHQYLQTMVEFPPRQEPDHYSVSNVLDKIREKARMLETAHGGGVR
jgi:arylsulfatase